MRWRTRPVVIEAERVSSLLTLAQENWQALPQWFRDAYERGDLLLLPRVIEISTLEGRMNGDWEDWIIQGVKGELYPCKPDIFIQTYEPADPPEPADISKARPVVPSRPMTPDAPREPQPCQYGVDHDQNICGRTPTKLFRWSGERYAWRCELHEPTRFPSTDAVLVDAPRETVARDADLKRIHDAFRHGGTSEGFALSQVEQLCREARDRADALEAERDEARHWHSVETRQRQEAEAEVAALRAELQKIAEWGNDFDPGEFQATMRHLLELQP